MHERERNELSRKPRKRLQRAENGESKRLDSSKKLRTTIVPALARLSAIGWFVAVSIVGGALLGWWIDGLIGTKPVMVICGVVLGVGIAMVGMIRMLNDFGKSR